MRLSVVKRPAFARSSGITSCLRRYFKYASSCITIAHLVRRGNLYQLLYSGGFPKPLDLADLTKLRRLHRPTQIHQAPLDCGCVNARWTKPGEKKRKGDITNSAGKRRTVGDLPCRCRHLLHKSSAAAACRLSARAQHDFEPEGVGGGVDPRVRFIQCATRRQPRRAIVRLPSAGMFTRSSQSAPRGDANDNGAVARF